MLILQSSAGLWNSLYDVYLEQSIQCRGQEGQVKMAEVLLRIAPGMYHSTVAVQE